jgi:hypothetical protein
MDSPWSNRSNLRCLKMPLHKGGRRHLLAVSNVNYSAGPYGRKITRLDGEIGATARAVAPKAGW